jgi:hypothetical protein
MFRLTLDGVVIHPSLRSPRCCLALYRKNQGQSMPQARTQYDKIRH